VAADEGVPLDRGAGGAGAAEVLASFEAPDEIRIGSHIDMRAADGSLVIGWLASQTDVLAEDWIDLDAPAQDPDGPGRAAYKRYLGASGGKSLVSGAELPGYDALPEAIRAAWRAAADPAAPRLSR
jgi:hypothetical protein